MGRCHTDRVVTQPTRRGVLLGAAALAAGAGIARAASRVDVRPDLSRPEGTADPSFPFDHLVVVMMENHSSRTSSTRS